MAKRSKRYSYINQHAAIETRPNSDAFVGGVSYTANREDDLNASLVTDSSNTTQFRVAKGAATLSLSGREARTLQRLLNKHFSRCSPAVFNVPGVE